MASFVKVLLILLLLSSLAPLSMIKAAVVINEFQVEPSGAEQWIELYNTGPETQDISGWFIDDNGGTEKYTIPSGTILGQNNCISFQSGNFNWNKTSSDSARLISGDNVVDEYVFSESPGSNISFGRSPDGVGSFTTFTNTTRDKSNNDDVSCLAPPTPTPISTATPVPTSTPTPIATATNTPVPTKTPTPTSLPTRVLTPTPVKTLAPTPASESILAQAQVLSESDVASPTPSEILPPRRSVKPMIISLLLVSTGLGILALGLVWQKRSTLKTDPK